MSQEAVVTAEPAAGVAAGESPINFVSHQVRANAHGARQDFEEMIGQLVKAVRPGVAGMIAANPGDWGIDVFVGDLGGMVTVWQSKYFMPEVGGKSHQAQIRESFDSVVKNASEQGFTLTQWILCVPSSMDGPMAKWWANWKRRKERETGIMIELWDDNELRAQLLSPDAASVRRHYYEPAARPMPRDPVSVVELAEEDAEKLDTALFVRQLREAGHVEVTASKRQFFNADLMAREVFDKGVPAEVAALSSADAVVHGIWEDHFNEACQGEQDARLPGLHKAVMGEIRAQHTTVGAGLPGGPVHTGGLMHRVVDNRRAGWVRHWRRIAGEHVGPETAPPQEASADQSLPKATPS